MLLYASCKRMMKITVFTPTYNRAYILPRTYESLLCQTYKDFEWVIIDDGSSDNTKELVGSWISEGKINITYVYQENQGRFAAYNTARKYFTGELVAFLDSDDVYVEICIERIVELWRDEKNKSNYGGILALMKNVDGSLIGSGFPENLRCERIYRLYDRHAVKGDKLIVLRRDLAQKHAYPVYKGEKFGGDSIVFNKISDECPMLLLNEMLVYREYLPDSITNNLQKHHLQSKNGMREHYKDCLAHEHFNLFNVVKHVIGYVAYSLITSKKAGEIIKESPKKIITLFSYPLGWGYSKKLRKYEKVLLIKD